MTPITADVPAIEKCLPETRARPLPSDIISRMSGQTCTGCGLKTRCSYGRWPDRHPRVAAAFAGLTGVVNLSDKHRTAATALVVPGTLVGLAAVATYPVVFVPLIVLFGVALVMVVGHEGTRRNPACWRTDCPAIRKFQQTRATISEQTP